MWRRAESNTCLSVGILPGRRTLFGSGFNWIEPPPPPRCRTSLVTLFGCEIAVYKLEARLPALSNGRRNRPLLGGFNSKALFLRTTWRYPGGQRARESEREREREIDQAAVTAIFDGERHRIRQLLLRKSSQGLALRPAPPSFPT
jgi:hypothetical protein